MIAPSKRSPRKAACRAAAAAMTSRWRARLIGPSAGRSAAERSRMRMRQPSPSGSTATMPVSIDRRQALQDARLPELGGDGAPAGRAPEPVAARDHALGDARGAVGQRHALELRAAVAAAEARGRHRVDPVAGDEVAREVQVVAAAHAVARRGQRRAGRPFARAPLADLARGRPTTRPARPRSPGARRGARARRAARPAARRCARRSAPARRRRRWPSRRAARRARRSRRHQDLDRLAAARPARARGPSRRGPRGG